MDHLGTLGKAFGAIDQAFLAPHPPSKDLGAELISDARKALRELYSLLDRLDDHVDSLEAALDDDEFNRSEVAAKQGRKI